MEEPGLLEICVSDARVRGNRWGRCRRGGSRGTLLLLLAAIDVRQARADLRRVGRGKPVQLPRQLGIGGDEPGGGSNERPRDRQRGQGEPQAPRARRQPGDPVLAGLRLPDRLESRLKIGDREPALRLRQGRRHLVRGLDGLEAQPSGAVERSREPGVGIVHHQLGGGVADPGAPVDRLDEPSEGRPRPSHRVEVTRADGVELGAAGARRDRLLRPTFLLADGADRPIVLTRRAVDASSRQQHCQSQSAHFAHPFRARSQRVESAPSATPGGRVRTRPRIERPREVGIQCWRCC